MSTAEELSNRYAGGLKIAGGIAVAYGASALGFAVIKHANTSYKENKIIPAQNNLSILTAKQEGPSADSAQMFSNTAYLQRDGSVIVMSGAASQKVAVKDLIAEQKQIITQAQNTNELGLGTSIGMAAVFTVILCGTYLTGLRVSHIKQIFTGAGNSLTELLHAPTVKSSAPAIRPGD